MVRIRTIGAAEIQLGDQRLTPRAELAFAFAIYLCARAGERSSRIQLVEMFWPDADEASGRHSLRQLLYRLRREGLDIAEEGEYLFVAPSSVDCDLREVLSERWTDLPAGGAFDSSASFLPGIRRDISSSFRDWVDSVAARVAKQVRRRALKQLAAARDEGRWGDMVPWADIILADDPLNEEATLAKAESYAMSGSKASALELLDAFATELGPNASRLSLPANLLRRRISERRHDWGSRPYQDSRLIGREDVMLRLSRQLHQAEQGTGGTAVLEGPPGAGKSRVLLELRRAAELRGFVCVDVRIDAAHYTRPFALAVQLATSLVGLPGAAGSSPEAMAAAKRLSLGTTSTLPAEGVGAADLTLAQLCWVLTDLMEAVSAERKLLVTVDDVHHADSSSVEVVAALALAIRRCRASLLLTCHAAALGALSAIDAVKGLTPIPIGPLSSDAARDLTTSIAGSLTLSLSDEQIESIVRASGGNPLFIRELVAFRDELSVTTRLPPSLVTIIDARLRQLSSEHLRILRLSCLLGPLATIGRLARATRARARSPTLAEVVEDLERDGIISSRELGTVTLHDCWRSSIDQAMTGAVRGALSHECAELLTSDLDDTDPTDRLWRAAELFVNAGSEADARRCLETCGDTLLERGLSRQAEAAFSRGVTLCRSSSDRVHFLSRKADSQARSGDHRLAIETAREAIALSTLLHPPLHTTHLQLITIVADGLFREGLSHHEALSDLATAVSYPGVPSHVRDYACLVAMRLSYNDSASELGAYFDGIIAENADPSAPSVYGELGRLIHSAETGTTEEVRSRCHSLGRIPLLEQPVHIRARALRYRATALRFIGDVAAAKSLLHAAHELASQVGDLVDMHATSMLLAFMALDYEELEEARILLARVSSASSYSVLRYQEIEMRHAEARLLLQCGLHRECLLRYADTIGAAKSDTMARRRLADAACIGLAAARCGEAAIAEEMLQITSRMVLEDRPQAQLDFPADAMVQTLKCLGRHSEAASAAREYIARRRQLYDRPIAPAFQELRAAYATSD